MKQLFPPSETFLQYVWKWQYFSTHSLKTTDDKPIKVILVGRWNRDQGPDFLNSCVEIDGIKLFGHVEIHLHSQDWYRHGHESDPFYNGTVLHVVFSSNQAEVIRADGSTVPELVMKDRIDVTLWQKYDRLRLSEEQIPCSKLLSQVKIDKKSSYLHALGKARIQRKASQLKHRLHKNRQNWSQILWLEIAQNLGGKVNGASFAAVAEATEVSWLNSCNRNVLFLEALIFGLAGLLDQPMEAGYPQKLKEEWEFLKRKHQLPEVIPIPLKYLRMHPASFPTIRFSQLAGLASAYPRLEDLLNPKGWEVFLKEEIKASPYWEEHNRFGQKQKAKSPKRLGRQQKESLILNVLAPLSLLYQQEHGREDGWESIEHQLENLSPENNRITRRWTDLGFPNEGVFHSQGILMLSKEYCLEKRCLECAIGQEIVSPG